MFKLEGFFTSVNSIYLCSKREINKLSNQIIKKDKPYQEIIFLKNCKMNWYTNTCRERINSCKYPHVSFTKKYTK